MNDYIKLGQRLVACKHFRWMPGMLTQCGIRIVEGGEDYIIGHRSGPTKDGGGWVDTVDLDEIYPDLSDAATKGCVLQLIRDAYQDHTMHIGIGCSGWVILSEKNRIADIVHHAANFDSEEQAMVLAMEGRK